MRESREELGLSISNEQVIGHLSELYIIASHFNILPVVAVLDKKPRIEPDEREVDYTISASIDDLMLPGVRKEKDITVRGYDIRAPYFDIENQIVWGATAMIINEFLTMVKEISHE